MSSNASKQKLYCYVDETGQDTMGRFFVVSVVLTADIRDTAVRRLEQIEKVSRKSKAKWTGARPEERLLYMKAVLSDPQFKDTLYFSSYTKNRDYMNLTVLTTARAIAGVPGHRVTSVYIDGLPKSRVNWFGTELRHLGVRTGNVVGVRREESNALIRLADACCGFVRQALFGTDQIMKALFELAKKEGYLKEL